MTLIMTRRRDCEWNLLSLASRPTYVIVSQTMKLTGNRHAQTRKPPSWFRIRI